MSLTKIAQNIKKAQDAVSQGQCTKRDICLAADESAKGAAQHHASAAEQRDAQHEGRNETPRRAQTTTAAQQRTQAGIHGANDDTPKGPHRHAAPTTQDESTEPHRASNTGPRRKGVAALGMALARKAMG
ncbi:hypothetical protein ERJ75_001142500 [Trypanosoma vivax]|nr:hypothetical protein ERJ75_001142500 [Trypanosoma vivax]